MSNRWIILVLLALSTRVLFAQFSISDDKAVFYRQSLTNLRALGTEAASKVAFDFDDAWNNHFTDEQQDQIHGIALYMQGKGYKMYPYFWHFYSYLAYSVSQAELTNDDVSQVLDINEEVVKTMTKPEYANFLLGLNIFMARRYLVLTKNLMTRTDGGEYYFKLLDEIVAAAESEEEPTAGIFETEEAPESLPWENNTITDDAWGSDDDWDTGDDWATDDWADDTWNTGNGEIEEAPAEPQRQVVLAHSEDFIQEKRQLYQHPAIEGPVIELLNNNMVMVTPYDSFKIKETSGSFLLKSRVYAGDDAIINWPAQNKQFKGAEVNLKKFKIGQDRSSFWTPNATLTFPGLFSGKIDGVFEYKSQRRKKGTLSSYPRFTSYEAGIQLNLPGDKVKYRGGIQFNGNELVGTSVSKRNGVLELLDGKGNKVIIRAEKFLFKDSVISTELGSFVIKHGIDSVSHSAVAIRYDQSTQQLKVLKNKKYETEPFYSTFFGTNIIAETIEWDMSRDSINFSILNGKDLIPVVIESDLYFNPIRFSRMASGFNFNPIAMAVFYANKYGVRSFNVDELVPEFKISRKQAVGAMTVLEKYGFADFNQPTGQVTLKDKAFHYYQASANKVDFDNLLMASKEPGRPNATMSLDSGKLYVHGVDHFFLTTDFKVRVEPDSGEVVLLKNRHMLFDGRVVTGDFNYKGTDFSFDYDGFTINMPEIDAIKIELHQAEEMDEIEQKATVSNQITETSGILYIDEPNNKAGLNDTEEYPYFTSNEDAVVYFDGEEVLNGAYDRSVRFLIPPFEEDSLDVDQAISFKGVFKSGGIFPEFEETLIIMPDQSLGFVHQIPNEGYNLYGTQARTYEKIYVSNDGIRGGGKIDFITSTIYSDDILYYPDSVAAFGSHGSIGAGEVNGASYPQAVLGPFRMHWLPRVDSMYLSNLYEPFKFYNATAQLTGTVNITSKGVYGQGELFTRGSQVVSEDMTFKQYSFSARHALFNVLTDNPDKPAMTGEDVQLNFDLTKNIAYVSPEKAGVAAISFPYAQMKTSITNAVWDLEDSIVTMTKPANVPLSKSYFYSTRPELDSLAFNGEKAVYDLNSKELNVQGIPFIRVADALIIPDNHETTILENSELQTFNNAEIIIDTVRKYHYLYSGEIKIQSRNAFDGEALYQLVTGKDTFAIRFNGFKLEDVPVSGSKTIRTTVSNGEVLGKEKLTISPGFYYKGNVKLQAYKKPLDLDGYVKLDLQKPNYDVWLKYERTKDIPYVDVDIEQSYYEDESPVLAGLHYDIRGSVYTNFIDQRNNDGDLDLFLAKGHLTYDTASQEYMIDNPNKAAGKSYAGHTMIYSDITKDLIFEGPVTFFGSYSGKVKLAASVLGSGNAEKNEYELDALMALDLPNSDPYLAPMAVDIAEVAERIGAKEANKNTIELMYKLANLTSDDIAKGYEKSSLKNYVPLFQTSEKLMKSLVISGVKMKWNQANNAWYNTTKIGLSNIYGNDINAKVDGFLEIKKDEANDDIFNLFIQVAPGTWYYLSYVSNTLMVYSSNSDVNLAVSELSNYGKAKAGDFVLVGGDENETLKFVNEFREKYFGITEGFDLVYPDDFSLEETESFDTIEDDKPGSSDDGFGF